MLDALLHLYKTVVVQPISDTPLDLRIADDGKYFPYFKDCVGALDGTHIHARVPTNAEAGMYRNRKGAISQNVLGCCNFDMRFTYILAGWPGAAHDSRVISDAKTRSFRIPQGKYYLADAGYANAGGLLTPYRRVRYHLREHRLADRK